MEKFPSVSRNCHLPLPESVLGGKRSPCSPSLHSARLRPNRGAMELSEGHSTPQALEGMLNSHWRDQG